MKTTSNYLLLLLAGVYLWSCTSQNKKEQDMKTFEKGTFGYDLNFLSEKDSLIVLKSEDGEAQVIVSPKYQGKVFTSTANGLAGKSIGFVNYDVLNSTVIDEHMNGYGGENRFWLGPEGGKYSIYFEPGKEQVFANWHTPKPIDIEPWDLKQADTKEVSLIKSMEVTNYQGTTLSLDVDRTIRMIDASDVAKALNISLDNQVKTVAYATENAITNKNDFEWTKETGTICIWMLDMFIPSDKAVTIIPFQTGDEKQLGKIATTNYFGEIPATHLKTTENALYLKTDGKLRAKLGLNALRSKSIAGNYDPITNRLTITVFDQDKNASYLNQEWNPSKDPLVGDAMNAYNDGPLEDGSIMGPFLEVESVSPAAFLKPEEKLSHKHTVYHFIGNENALDPIAKALLGVSVNEIIHVFN